MTVFLVIIEGLANYTKMKKSAFFLNTLGGYQKMSLGQGEGQVLGAG